jgi:hypothetical protein
VQFAIPFLLGFGHYANDKTTSNGLWLGFRPHITVGPEDWRGSWDEDRPRHDWWALGPYFDFGWHPVTGTKRLALGAGATGLLRVGRPWTLMPSFGWYRQYQDTGEATNGVSAGLFFGALAEPVTALQFPVGLRVDARYAVGSRREWALLVGGELDALPFLAMPVFFLIFANADWSFD